MCGIVGYISNRPSVWHADKKTYQEVLAQLVIIDSLRGQDSTGFFAVDRRKTVYHYKQAVPGWDFVQHIPVDKIFNHLDDMRVVAFHNRFATIGGAGNKLAAHPFNFESVIGMHNGTLLNHRDLIEGETFINDSEALIAAMNEYGPVEALQKAHGPVATAFYDKDEQNFCLYRNTERPMAIAKLKDDDTFFFASEKDMLLMVLNRSNVKIDWINDLDDNTMRAFLLEDKTYKDYHVKTYTPPKQKFHQQAPHGTGGNGTNVTKLVDHVMRRSHQFNKKSEGNGFLPPGYKVGDQHLMEVTSIKQVKGGRSFHAIGNLVNSDEPKAIVHGLTKLDAENITKFLPAKDDSFLMYVKVMSCANPKVKDHEAFICTPSKPITEYATQKVQNKIIEHFATFDTGPVDDLTEGTTDPKPVLFSPVINRRNDPLGDASKKALEDDDKEQPMLPMLLGNQMEQLGLESDKEGSKSEFGKADAWVLGPNHRPITRAEFNRMVSGGCGVCGHPLHHQDNIDWDSYKDSPCHRDCVTHSELGG